MDGFTARASVPPWTILGEDDLVSEMDETLFGESSAGDAVDELESNGTPVTQGAFVDTIHPSLSSI